MADGQVLIAGGNDVQHDIRYLGGVELYDPASAQWMPGPPLLTPRSHHAAVALLDGRVLVVGGLGAGPNGEVGLAKAEVYQGPVAIGPGFTGAWYDPAQAGHGLLVEVLPGHQLLAAWLTFDPAGNQAWFTGVGTYSGNTGTVTAVDQPSGGRWFPYFDPRQIAHHPWGTLTFTFSDCNHGVVQFSSTAAGYGSGSMNLTRLTQAAGLACP